MKAPPRKRRTKKTLHDHVTEIELRKEEVTALTPKVPVTAECTPLTAARIAGYISQGDTPNSAAAKLGISTRTLRKWRRLADDPETPLDTHYRSFFATVDAAVAECVKQGFKKLKKMAFDDQHPQQIRALERYLKTLDPDTFGDKTKTEITGEDGDPIKIDQRIALLTDAELDARIRELENERQKGHPRDPEEPEEG